VSVINSMLESTLCGGKNETTRGPKNACPVSSIAFIQRTVPYTRLP
jgi:hypothetical protein